MAKEFATLQPGH